MSHDARTWVWDHSYSKGTARLVLALIADRCLDRNCIAYASVPALMKRANASRSAVRDALNKLVEEGELRRIPHRKGPRGETYYQLLEAARHLAGQAAEEDQIPPREGPASDPIDRVLTGPGDAPGDRTPAPGRAGYQPSQGTDSSPQNSSELSLNGKSSSSAAPITATEWQIDDATEAWLEREGHARRLGRDGLRAADDKWRTYRSSWAPRVAAAWAADWRSWIAREHTPTPERPQLRVLPGEAGNTHAPRMTRAETYMAALVDAVNGMDGME
ncbi:helix-turn-helix domain-containing protein [Streptomyces atriruber]|uniref:Helix-turn-helix domain-containing protein n=1 Tax=Streptomyces atriruber TaxID=545121 RepID=A0ABV3BZ40_9ACTN